jgi:DNA-binding transcriptional MerR regulator
MPATSAPGADPDRLLTIGELAARSSLRASALRFYDREGVLVPADVDPLTGYRRYAAAQVRAARLLASLRRVGMPLAEVALVLEEDARGASGTAADVVRAHEQRLVDGLADARREIGRTLALLAERGLDAGGRGRRVTVRAGELTAAIGSVRFAVAPGEPVAGSPDGPDLRVLTGLLLEVCGAELRCVATDRYRLAVGWAPLVADVVAADPVGGGRGTSAVVPADWADRVADACSALPADHEVVVDVGEDGVGAVVDGELLATPVLSGTYPDYRSILVTDPGRPALDAAGLRGLLPVEQDVVGLVVGDGEVRVHATDGSGAEAVADLYVDPEFLEEALAVAGPRPTLVLDGPHRPLAIRGDGAGFSVLMPVAPERGGPERG